MFPVEIYLPQADKGKILLRRNEIKKEGVKILVHPHIFPNWEKIAIWLGKNSCPITLFLATEC